MSKLSVFETIQGATVGQAVGIGTAVDNLTSPLSGISSLENNTINLLNAGGLGAGLLDGLFAQSTNLGGLASAYLTSDVSAFLGKAGIGFAVTTDVATVVFGTIEGNQDLAWKGAFQFYTGLFGGALLSEAGPAGIGFGYSIGSFLAGKLYDYLSPSDVTVNSSFSGLSVSPSNVSTAFPQIETGQPLPWGDPSSSWQVWGSSVLSSPIYTSPTFVNPDPTVSGPVTSLSSWYPYFTGLNPDYTNSFYGPASTGTFQQIGPASDLPIFAQNGGQDYGLGGQFGPGIPSTPTLPYFASFANTNDLPAESDAANSGVLWELNEQGQPIGAPVTWQDSSSGGNDAPSSSGGLSDAATGLSNAFDSALNGVGSVVSQLFGVIPNLKVRDSVAVPESATI
jgi:hypothetical protein